MENLTVLKPNNKKLRQQSVDIEKLELRTKAFQSLVNSLLDFTYGKNNKGSNRNTNKPSTVGLSAIQLGISKKIIIVDLGIGHKSYSDLHVLINPEIIWQSKSLTYRAEGCVNLPQIWGIVKRSNRIKIKALDRSGNYIMLDMSGWPAILIQHEIDHLNGKLFIDKIEDPKKAFHVKEEEYKQFKKLKTKWDKFIDVSKLIVKN